jgi:two-component system, chemotaxis family, chemotaxis protein CheY
VNAVPKILVVEDSFSMRAFVRSALETGSAELGGVDVVEASGGFEALRLLPRGPYDLVITDINMPDINGLELIQFIRSNEHHRSTPILLISTQSSERDRARGMSLGADDYVAKPFTPEDLKQKVKAQLERGRAPARGDG